MSDSCHPGPHASPDPIPAGPVPRVRPGGKTPGCGDSRLALILSLTRSQTTGNSVISMSLTFLSCKYLHLKAIAKVKSCHSLEELVNLTGANSSAYSFPVHTLPAIFVTVAE